MSTTAIPVLMDRVAQLVIARKQAPLSQYTSPLHVPISGSQTRGWDLWINGAREKRKIVGADEGTMANGCDVPPFTVAVFWNGWLAGFISPGGGTMCAGEVANEDALLAAIEEQIEKCGDGR